MIKAIISILSTSSMTEAHKNATVLTRAPDIEETSKIIFLISQQKYTVKLQWLEHDGSFTIAVSNSCLSP